LPILGDLRVEFLLDLLKLTAHEAVARSLFRRLQKID
jgi:hypothetical protein